MMAALMAAGDQVGCAWMTSAAVPVMCGDAIDVPETTRLSNPVPMPAETMVTPGRGDVGLEMRRRASAGPPS